MYDHWYTINSLLTMTLTSQIIEMITQGLSTNLVEYPCVLWFHIVSQKANQVSTTYEITSTL